MYTEHMIGGVEIECFINFGGTQGIYSRIL